MRLLVLSDLHVEHAFFALPAGLQYDAVILAGDILTPGHRVPHWARRETNFGTTTPIVLTLGNHELYTTLMSSELAAIRAAAAGTNLHILERDELLLTDTSDPSGRRQVRFLGCMLWTNFALGIVDGRESHSDVELALGAANRSMNDFRLISVTDTSGPDGIAKRRLLTAEDTAAMHAIDRAWLLSKLSEPFDGPTVVVTHHGPCSKSVHPRFASDWLTSAFVSDLPPEFFGANPDIPTAKPALWVHGHVHNSFDYEHHGVRVLANPRGYRLRDSSFENRDFKPGLIVTV